MKLACPGLLLLVVAVTVESAAIASQAATDAEYVGCYVDKHDRAMTGDHTQGLDMTIDLCTQRCADQGYIYAAVHFSFHCFCGNEYDRYGEASNCDMPCMGDRSKMCGGGWANQVYRVGADIEEEPAAACAAQTVGHEVVQHANLDTAKHWTYVDVKNPFETAGVVNTIEVFAGHDQRPLKVGIFKQASDRECHMELLQQIDFPSFNAGYNKIELTPDMELTVEAGDYYGFTWTNYGVISYDYVNEKEQYCEARVQPDVNDPLNMELKRHTNRDYAIRLSYSAEDCKDGEDGGEGPLAPQYIGCYLDKHERAMTGQTTNTADMTIALCTKTCADAGFIYAALQHSSQCFCGDDYDKYGETDNCNLPCIGDRAEMCGGGWANQVYRVDGIKEIPRAQKIGCFRDNDIRALTGSFSDDQAMTNKRCIEQCLNEGFEFAATQYSTECFCGDAYDRYGPADNCDSACGGDGAQTCGGSWAMTVYRVGIWSEGAECDPADPTCKECNKIQATNWCYASGDPHYNTFDRYMIHFMGTCGYTLVQPKPGTELDTPDFEVVAKNQHRHGNTHVSYVEYTLVRVYDLEIKISLNKEVFVDGEEVTVPWRAHDRVCIELDHFGPLITTDFGLKVQYDGSHFVKVGLPDAYKNNIQGMCGNWDGNAHNDMSTKDGTQVDVHDYTAVGNSYQARGIEGDGCLKETPSENKCDDTVRAELTSTDRCGIMSDKKGPFKHCSGDLNPEQIIENCVFDGCNSADDEQIAAVCNMVESYEAECNNAGKTVDQWRREDFCPMACGENMEVSEEASRCPNTCDNLQAANTCKAKPRRGCVCKAGFVMSGFDCVAVDDCGCSFQHQYFKRGAVWGDHECGARFTCEGAAGRIKEELLTCADENAECRTRGQRKGCYCKKGMVQTDGGGKCVLEITAPPQRDEPTTKPDKAVCDDKSIYSLTAQECVTLPDLGVGGCAAQADIVFVVDSSGSVGRKNFEKIKQFCMNFVSSWPVGPEEGRFGLIRFSNRVSTIYELDSYKAQTETVAATRDCPFVGGRTNTADALVAARDMIERKARKDVPTFIVLVTDGVSNKPEETIEEAKKNNDAGIVTYAIGVGKRLNEDELREIAGQEGRVVVKASFASLINGFSGIAADACKESCTSDSCVDCAVGHYSQDDMCYVDQCAVNQPCRSGSSCKNWKGSYECTCPAAQMYCKSTGCVATLAECNTKDLPVVKACENDDEYFSKRFGCIKMPTLGSDVDVHADVVFVVDGSRACGVFEDIKQFVKAFIENFKVDKHGANFGVVRYTDEAEVVLPLNDKNKKDDIIEAVAELGPADGTATNTHLGLEAARDHLAQEGRKNAVKIVIVIHTGRADQTEKLDIVSEELKEEAEVFSLGVGFEVSLDELKKMSTEPPKDHVMMTHGPTTLIKSVTVAALKILNKVCKKSSCVRCPSKTVMSHGMCWPDYCRDSKELCGEKSECTNQDGFYACSCQDTYVMDPVTKKCVQDDGPAVPECGKDELYSWAEGQCTSRPNLGEGCDSDADMLFLLDSSSNVGAPNFALIKEFAIGVVEEFKQVRVSVIRFSNEASVETSLDTNFRDNDVRKIDFVSGGTRTDLALKAAREELEKNGSRGAPKVVILITDGTSSQPDDTRREAQDLKDMGAKILTVGIGMDLDMTELEAVATAADSNFIVQIQSFAALPYIVSKVAASTCLQTCGRKNDCFECKKHFMMSAEEGVCVRDFCDSKPCKRLRGSQCVNVDNFFECQCPDGFYEDGSKCTRAAVCPSNQMFSRNRGKCVTPGSLGDGCSSKADILFVIDGSTSVRRTNFDKTISFVNAVARQFPIGQDANRIAAIQFSSSSQTEFDFSDNKDNVSIERAISAIRYKRGGTRTEKAINMAMDVMKGARADALPIIIFLTDGTSNNHQATMEAAQRLRATAYQVYAVGVGARLDPRELEAIATKPANKMMVHDFDGLQEIAEQLALSTCDDAKATCVDGNCITCKDGEREENGLCYTDVCGKQDVCIGQNVECVPADGSFTCECTEPGQRYNTRYGCKAPGVSTPDPAVTCKDGTQCNAGFECVKDERKKKEKKEKDAEVNYTCQCKQGYVSFLDKATNTMTCMPGGECSGSGDPHYYTWDGQAVHFMGACVYLFAGTLPSYSGSSPFEVRVKSHRKPEKSADVSFIQYAEVVFDTTIIRIDQGKVTTFNGVALEDQYFVNADVEVKNTGSFMEVRTSFGLVVKFDGNTKLIATLPEIYKEQVEGLCASWDDNKDNDLTVRGTDEIVYTYMEFGNSYMVKGGAEEEEGECVPVTVEDATLGNCDDATRAQAETLCNNMADTDGPFAPCHKFIAPGDAVTSCVTDSCATFSDEDLCAAFASYASDCAILDVRPRYMIGAAEICLPDCPDNMHFEYSMSGCPASCTNPTSDDPAICAEPRESGCACDEGYMLSGDGCVPQSECGCFKEGTYFKLGRTWMNNVCSMLYECAEPNKIMATPMGCPASEGRCEIRKQQWGCVCEDNVDEMCHEPNGPPTIEDSDLPPLPVLLPNTPTDDEVVEEPVFVGCFRDKSVRALSAEFTEGSDMTIQLCRSRCADGGFAFAGLQYSVECFCGAAYDIYGVADNCDRPCAGDATQTCGGSWANSVYKVGPEDEPLPDVLPLEPEPQPEVLPLVPEPQPEVLPLVPEPQPDVLPLVPEPEVLPLVPEPEPEVLPLVPEPEPEVLPLVPEPEPEVLPLVPEPEPEVLPLVPEPEPEVLPLVPEPEPEVLPLVPEPEPEVVPQLPETLPGPALGGPTNPWKRPVFKDGVKYDEPDEEGEDNDDKYFALKPEPTPAPKPKELGMANGIIGDSDVTASSFLEEQLPTDARPNSDSGWMPEQHNNPFLQIDLRRPTEVHGFGSLGDYQSPCWASEYVVATSLDGKSYQPLGDLSNDQQTPRVFLGNTEQNTWKRHCIHRYYGEPLTTRYIRFYPITDSNDKPVRESTKNAPDAGCVAMRVELYGFRDAEDPQFIRALKKDTWTKSTDGCQCYFDKTRFDCACCRQGGAQCPSSSRHQCVQSGYAAQCGIPEIDDQKDQVDPWTATKTGCQCDHDSTRFDCACCQRYGCQCGEMQKNQCVQCGQTDEQCGNNPEKFGPPDVCRPKSCPAGSNITN